MNTPPDEIPHPLPTPKPPRRPRYSGKYPRQFSHKYKEHHPEQHPATIEKILAAGKTPAGTHRPILVDEVLQVLAPQPGELGVDCTLGYGGHATHLLARLQPGGRLIALDVDPAQLPRTEARLRAAGFGPEHVAVYRSNFAGLSQLLSTQGISGADFILADLGVSSMQLDDPERGFSFKQPGPLDMRMNTLRGQPASAWMAAVRPETLIQILQNNADEPHAALLGRSLAGQLHPTTVALRDAIRRVLAHRPVDEVELSIRRVFQALRIAVNDEFSALETFLRFLPACLKPKGRVAILTFHSGEDRRVKHAFTEGKRAGIYSAVAQEVVRPSPSERRDNPRSSSAKLRWAVRAKEPAAE